MILELLRNVIRLYFYALKEEDSESFYALNPEIIHYAYIYRLILECCSNDAEIELDFSNLELWADDCIPKALEATEDIEKIIVLVEGTSDKDILEFAMSHLYPHLSDLFISWILMEKMLKKRGRNVIYKLKILRLFIFLKSDPNLLQFLIMMQKDTLVNARY